MQRLLLALLGAAALFADAAASAQQSAPAPPKTGVAPAGRKGVNVGSLSCNVAGGTGLISGRKAFQRPLKEGIKLLNLIQDVYLDKDITIA